MRRALRTRRGGVDRRWALLLATFAAALLVMYSSFSALSWNEDPLHSLQAHSTLRLHQASPSCSLRYDHVFQAWMQRQPPLLGKDGKPLQLYVASNIKDQGHVLPHFMSELLRLAQFVGPENLFISLYESGSKQNDGTREYMEQFRSILMEKNIRNHIVIDGDATRQKGEMRIHFTARLRNEGMKSLYESPRGTFDYVVWLNDVFYCAEDIIRLLTYRPDLACGYDLFTTSTGNFQYYDTWTGVDVYGKVMFDEPVSFPWIQEATDKHGTISLARQRKAFPVLCCWNGLAVVDATPFYEGLRFRTGQASGSETECAGPEGTLMCKDFWLRNRTRILMDPNVLVAYDFPTYHQIDLKWNTGLFWPGDLPDPMPRSAEAPANAISRVLSRIDYPPTYYCCGLILDPNNVFPDVPCCFYKSEIPGTEHLPTPPSSLKCNDWVGIFPEPHPIDWFVISSLCIVTVVTCIVLHITRNIS